MLDSGDFFQFSHRKILTCLQHSENDTKSNEIFPLLTCARFTIRPPLPFTRISRLLLLPQFFKLFFYLYCVSSPVSAISEVVFTVFSTNLSKSMQDIIFPNAATVLWYFEALLIGIILPQFEGRFKHFLLVIRIIHTSRSFLQKQHQQFFFSGERY